MISPGAAAGPSAPVSPGRAGAAMLKEMRYVYAVYRERGFSRAARSLHVTQPVVSTMVKRAEEEFHAQIFNRSTSPVSLTPAGRLYIQAIEKIFTIEDEVLGLFSNAKAHGSQQLRIGASSFQCTYILPPLLADFKRIFPGAEVQWKEAHNEGLVKMLQDGELDFVVEADDFDPGIFDCIILSREFLILAVPREDPINRQLRPYRYTGGEICQNRHLADPRPCPLDRFAQKPFVFLQDSNDVTMRSIMACRRAGFQPDIVMQVDQLVTAYNLAKKGVGSTILPDNFPQYIDDAGRLFFYVIDSPLVHRTVKLYRCRGHAHSPLMQNFWEYAAHLGSGSACAR